VEVLCERICCKAVAILLLTIEELIAWI
jgi:hypothetical protein